MPNLSHDQRRRLQSCLLEVQPWLQHDNFGPTTVDAGECDRCANEVRLVETCGPVPWRRLGRLCLVEVGLDAWCDGHQRDGDAAIAWAKGLPAEADDAARLWWVATGEVRLDSMAALASRCLPAADVSALQLD